MVVMWTTFRLLLVLILTHGWKSRQLDFVLVYPQADVEGTIFMRLPKGFVLYGGKTHHTHMLKLLKKIYGLKLAGRV